MCTLYTLMGAVIFALVIGTISEMAQQENRFTNAVSHNLHGSLSLPPPTSSLFIYPSPFMYTLAVPPRGAQIQRMSSISKCVYLSA